MRISASVFLALPLLAFAAEEAVPEGAAAAEGVAEGAAEGLAGEAADTGAFGQYKAQFQNFLGSFGGKPAAESDKVKEMKAAQAAVEEVPVEGDALSKLTLENWHETLFGELPEDTTTPQEWWLFVTGRNKTCNGKLPLHCPLSQSGPGDANASPQATATRPRLPSTRRPPGSTP